MDQRVEVIIIGSGTAGLSAQSQVSRKTDNYVVINDGPYGTSCARVACMPTKTLLEAAHAFQRRLFLERIGVEGAGRLSIDIPGVLQYVRRMRDRFAGGMVKATEKLGEKVIQGRAQFVAPDTVEVDGRRIRARKVIIATGSRPVVPEDWRTFGDRIITTDEFFEQENLPRRIGVVGLGPAGIEFAQALAHLGIETIGFDAGGFISGLSDPKVNEVAMKTLSADLPLYVNQEIDINRDGDGLVIDCAAGRFHFDKVLLAVGRRPNVDRLGLERLGVKLDESGIPLYDPVTLRLLSQPIYIAGDANGERAILHEAVDEGRVAGYNAVRGADQLFRRRVSLAITFTEPNIARVGSGYVELQKNTPAGSRAAHWAVGEQTLDGQGRARMTGDDRGVIRVYAAKAEGRLLGAELVAPSGEHLAHLLAVAIERNLAVQELLSCPFYHPTIEEGLGGALRKLAKKVAGTFDPLASMVLPPGAR